MLRFLTLSKVLFSIFLFFFCWHLSIAEKPEDFIINADDLFVDKESGNSRFMGNVIIWFDNGIVIETSELLVNIKEDGKKRDLERIIIPTSVRAVKFESCASETPEITLIAGNAEYIVESAELHLGGGIYMQKNENLVKCEKLVYYTKISKIVTKKK
ncbi:MAG: hypothetical protein KA998_01800 [Rickettsiaceae bacterium]|nr:hypothetical protein [Rickettsiaceae bacterium]